MEKPDISKEAISFIKKQKRVLLEKFADLEKYPSQKNPFSIFMAGSPGAGKTEFSKRWTKRLSPIPIVRIDADEIREFIPQYNGKNSDLVQGASALGVDKIYDHILKNNQNALLDGTFAKYEISKKNIERSLKRNRRVGIFYVYQDPLVAWDFTKKREKLEGRYVPKDSFVQSFFKSRENVWLAKKEFGNKIELNLVIKNAENKDAKIEFDIARNIDKFIKIDYNRESLSKLLC